MAARPSLTTALRFAPLALAFGLIVVIAACGGGKSLDMKKLQDSIRGDLEQGGGLKLDSVSCPDRRDIKAGDTFDCTAAVGSQQLKLQVEQTDDQGNVRYSSRQAILDVRKLAQQVEQGIGQQARVSAKVDCGKEQVLFKEPGETFNCTATDNAGTSRGVVVTVKDKSGQVDWKLQ